MFGKIGKPVSLLVFCSSRWFKSQWKQHFICSFLYPYHPFMSLLPFEVNSIFFCASKLPKNTFWAFPRLARELLCTWVGLSLKIYQIQLEILTTCKGGWFGCILWPTYPKKESWPHNHHVITMFHYFQAEHMVPCPPCEVQEGPEVTEPLKWAPRNYPKPPN